jgi:hypothetical protein
MAVAAGARALGQKQSETGQPGRPVASPTSPGPQHPMLHLQQTLGNQAVLGLLGSGTREASGGRPLPSAVRGLMEQRFAADFGGVRVHTDSRSAALSRLLQAKAFTRGSDIYFSAGRYSPGSPGGERLLAHELAHVVQQRGSAGGTARLGDPGSAAERGAELAAEAVMAGAPVPHPGVAPAGEVQRAVDTNGGQWETTKYVAVNDGVGVGAEIRLEFRANELVEADSIGLVQTVKTLKNTRPGGPVDTPSSPTAQKASIKLTDAEGDRGRGIDQLESDAKGSTPNTNPLYASDKNKPGAVSQTLTDVGAKKSLGAYGHRIRRPAPVPGGPPTWDIAPAVLKDYPEAGIKFAGEQWRMSFEVAALVLDGPMANTYLGSIEWGWLSDAASYTMLSPNPIRVVRAGAPTAQFMAAAKKWNDTTFTDSAGTRYPTVDLPLTTGDSGSASVQARTTSDLITRQATVEGELKALPAGADRTNKEFEKQAITVELRKRYAMVSVHVVNKHHPTGGDNIYVRLSGAGRSVQSTVVDDIAQGDGFDFSLQLSSLLPLTGPVTVAVFDKNSPNTADQIVGFTWPSPYGPASNTSSMSGANYSVTVRFDEARPPGPI